MSSQTMRGHLGILGGGQLGRMLAMAAHPLGLKVSIVEPDPEAPAADVANHILETYESQAAFEQLSACDWITFEFENVPEKTAQNLSQRGCVHPPADALRTSQDRLAEKSLFDDLKIATAEYRQIDSLDDATKAWQELGPLVLKTRRFGYDGKGQAVVRSEAEIPKAYATLQGAPAIAEALIPFDRELSVLICRSENGQVEIYPVTENTHRQGVLRTSVAPAPNLTPDLEAVAKLAARQLVEHLSYVGVLALELFEVNNQLLANEFAPRVHNSGHWTIEGAVTSQFENHVRAVCGLPLGSAKLRAPSVMTNLLGHVPPAEVVLALPDTHLHDYGKSARPGRKVGHITTLGGTPEEAQQRALKVEKVLSDHRVTSGE